MIAQPGTEGAIGAVVAMVASGTRYTPFVFEATQNYPALLLRINSPTFSGPGRVIYAVTVEAPSK